MYLLPMVSNVEHLSRWIDQGHKNQLLDFTFVNISFLLLAGNENFCHASFHLK